MKGALAASAILLTFAIVGAGVTSAQTAIDKSAAKQAGRERLMKKLGSEGIFQKIVVPGNLPRLYVAPRFYRLDFDTKQNFVSVVYAYYFDGKNVTDAVRIYDGRSGKEIGSYTVTQGLKLD